MFNRKLKEKVKILEKRANHLSEKIIYLERRCNDIENLVAPLIAEIISEGLSEFYNEISACGKNKESTQPQQKPKTSTVKKTTVKSDGENAKNRK